MTAHVSVFATYYVAGRTILPGDVIQVGDLVPRDGDLSVMPRAIVTDPQQAIGAVAQNRLSAGMPLRSDLIRSPMAIELGQTVQVVAQGQRFFDQHGRQRNEQREPRPAGQGQDERRTGRGRHGCREGDRADSDVTTR